MKRAPELCALVGSVEDADALRAAGARRVYLDVTDCSSEPDLVEGVRERGLVPVLGEVCREADHVRIDPWVMPGHPVAVGNVSELTLARERGALAELRSCVPVHNTATLGAMAGLGARFAWLSPELSLDEIRELAAASPVPLGLTVFGRPRLMTLEHCVLQVAYGCDRKHECCPYRARRHWLVNIDGRRLPVRTDGRGRSRVYLDEPLDLVGRACEFSEMGVGRLLVDARTTSPDEAVAVLGRLRLALAGGVAGEGRGSGALGACGSSHLAGGDSAEGREGLLAHGVE